MISSPPILGYLDMLGLNQPQGSPATFCHISLVVNICVAQGAYLAISRCVQGRDAS